MQKLIRGFLVASAVLLAAGAWQSSAVAAPPKDNLPNDNAVIRLGFARDVDGRLVEGYRIIHYRRGPAKPPGAGGGSGGGTSTCYAFLASGAKWKTVEPWVFNPNNSHSLESNLLFNVLNGAIGEWEAAAGTNIFGPGSTATTTLSADTASPLDNLNEVYFGSIADADVIAVTTVWGFFSGPPSTQSLVEWDMVFDDTDFDWSTSGADDAMDFENIAQHELGHAMGLGHPSDSCIDETMYRYASDGETKKRSLSAGDVAGINALY